VCFFGTAPISLGAAIESTVGRRKYVKPLYEAMDPKHSASIYEKARPLYHPITQATVDSVIPSKK
jgi:hypothetical protein